MKSGQAFPASIVSVSQRFAQKMIGPLVHLVGIRHRIAADLVDLPVVEIDDVLRHRVGALFQLLEFEVGRHDRFTVGNLQLAAHHLQIPGDERQIER